MKRLTTAAVALVLLAGAGGAYADNPSSNSTEGPGRNAAPYNTGGRNAPEGRNPNAGREAAPGRQGPPRNAPNAPGRTNAPAGANVPGRQGAPRNAPNVPGSTNVPAGANIPGRQGAPRNAPNAPAPGVNAGRVGPGVPVGPGRPQPTPPYQRPGVPGAGAAPGPGNIGAPYRPGGQVPPNFNRARRPRDAGRRAYAPGAFPQVFRATRRFRSAPFIRPPGWYARRWSYGMFLPWGWFAPAYYLNWALYGLPPPPIGCEWIREGGDALLVNIWTGEVLSVYLNVFWW